MKQQHESEVTVFHAKINTLIKERDTIKQELLEMRQRSNYDWLLNDHRHEAPLHTHARTEVFRMSDDEPNDPAKTGSSYES